LLNDQIITLFTLSHRFFKINAEIWTYIKPTSKVTTRHVLITIIRTKTKMIMPEHHGHNIMRTRTRGRRRG